MHHHLVKSNSTLITDLDNYWKEELKKKFKDKLNSTQITDLDNNWKKELIKKIKHKWVNGKTIQIILDTIPNIVEYIVKDEENLDTIPNILEAEFKKEQIKNMTIDQLEETEEEDTKKQIKNITIDQLEETEEEEEEADSDKQIKKRKQFIYS
jgi:hypothetical protein